MDNHEFKVFAWITNGKKLENYMSIYAINEALNYTKHGGQFFPNFSDQKIKFTPQIKKFLTANNPNILLDLEEQMKCLCAWVKCWSS